MTYSIGNAGTVAYSPESAFGVQTGSYSDIRTDKWPEYPETTEVLSPVPNAGHRNPLSQEKGVVYDIGIENGLKFAMPIHRPASAAGTPDIATFAESAGWNVAASADSTTAEAGSQSATNIELTAGQGSNFAEGDAILAAVGSTYRPVLVNTLSGDNITPMIAMSAACGNSATIKNMHCITPTTSNTYNVDSDKTLHFKVNTWAQIDDALGDKATLLKGCALGELSAIEIGGAGTVPLLNTSFHVAYARTTTAEADDIDADNFNESAPHIVINDDFEFAFASASSGEPIGTLTSKDIISITINPGMITTPRKGVGSGSLGGWTGYRMVPTSPTITIKCYYNNDTNFEASFWTELAGSNTSKYIHAIQPTRSLTSPSFGAFMPNCHIMAGGEPKCDFADINPTVECTFIADLTNLDAGGTDIDDVSASPIYLAIYAPAS